MDTLISTIEELTLNAWPAIQTVFYDGWILRCANGYTRRANSILPLYPAHLPPAQKIAWCENVYRRVGLPVVFKLAGRSESRALNEFLIGLGYRPEADTSVQVADIHAWPDEISASVHLSATQTPEWEAAYSAMSGLREEQQAKHRQILAAILPEKCFASIHVNGAPAGCAMCVLQDKFIGIYDVIVAPAFRRQGYGERLLRSLLAWGKQQNAQSAYLQVMLNNPAALRLYERLGFREQYQYWYCVKKFHAETPSRG